MHRAIFDGFPFEGVGLGTVQGIVCGVHPLLLGRRGLMRPRGVFSTEARCGLLEIVLGLWWLQEVIFGWRLFYGFSLARFKNVPFIFFFELVAGFCNTASNF
jgi:hypothetical protein